MIHQTETYLPYKLHSHLRAVREYLSVHVLPPYQEVQYGRVILEVLSHLWALG